MEVPSLFLGKSSGEYSITISGVPMILKNIINQVLVFFI